jgi:hypothetical protein
MGMMENIYNSITKDCGENDIVVMLDGDDSFIGRNVLLLLNAVYQREKIALMWTNYLSITNNELINIGSNTDYSSAHRKYNVFRRTRAFFSSHLKSFYAYLFNKINISDLQD